MRPLYRSCVLLVGAATIAGCAAGNTPSTAATTPASPQPTAPWSVMVDAASNAALGGPAYVSARDGDALVTAPTRKGEEAKRAEGLLAHAAAGTGVQLATVPRAIVGVIRQPGAATKLVTLRATSNGDGRSLSVTTLAPDGITSATTRRIATRLPLIGSAAFAQNAAGDGVLVWSESRIGGEDDDVSGDRMDIRMATGRWGHFGRPRALRTVRGSGAAAAAGLAVDVNATGRAVIASDAFSITAWVGSARSGRFSAPVVRRPPTLVGPMRVAMTDRGRAVIAWRDSNGDAMDPHGAVIVRATTLAPGSRQLSRIQSVDRGPEDYPSLSGLDLVATPGDGATLAFSAPRDDPGPGDLRETALAATLAKDGRFGVPQELAHSGSVGGLAVRADGTTVVTYVDRDGSPTASLGARLRVPGNAAFGPAEHLGAPPAQAGLQPVTTQPQFISLLIPQPDAPLPSFDPVTGRPLIAWTSAPGKGTPGRVVVVQRERP